MLFLIEWLVELNDLGPAFTLWSNSEQRLNVALNAVAKATGKNYMALQRLVNMNLTRCSMLEKARSNIKV